MQTDTDLCNSEWVLQASPDQIRTHLPSMPDEAVSWDELPGFEKGVLASPAGVLLIVQGRSASQVVLTGLDVQVQHRRRPLDGTHLTAPCGDAGAARWMEVDLDRSPPRTRTFFVPESLDSDAKNWERKPIRFPYKVSLAEAEVFLVSAGTKGCDCSWTMELSWSSEGRVGKMHIDDHGTPFRVTAVGRPDCLLYAYAREVMCR